MRVLTLLIAALLSICAAHGAPPAHDFKVAGIADSLKKNAYAVVRFSEMEFDYKSEKTASEKNSIAITVLDKKGTDFADFSYSGDRFRQLRNFSGTLYDGEGRVLRKFKMADVRSTELSTSLASDGRFYFFSCQTPVIPFTVHYEYEVAWNSGRLSFPVFFPQNGFNLSVERAVHTLSLPPDVEFRSYCKGRINPEPTRTDGKEKVKYQWNAAGLKAVDHEPLIPDFTNYTPILFLRPQNFVYDNTTGSFTDWESMGLWEFSLLKDRDNLTEATKTKIAELTKNCETDREKVRVLYDWLGQTTRYVSIQLGIGGYQPITAEEVCRTGFGDCKGLTNYLRAMLKVVGIESHYTTIRADDSGNKTLFPDYPNFHQMNHAVLQVPLPGDTLWLECTNTKLPFGFVHNGISGQEALEISERGGRVVRLPDYPDSLNIEKNSGRIVIAPDGSAKATVRKEYRVKIYGKKAVFTTLKPSEQTDYLRKDICLTNVALGPLQVTENKESLPSLTVDYTWSTQLYGTKTGNRLFIPLNPFQNSFMQLNKQNRQHDFEIRFGFQNIDELFIEIPAEFEIESMPANFAVDTPYGYLHSEISRAAGGIVIHQKLLLRQGRYAVEKYPEFIDFVSKANTAYEGKITLRKK